MRSLIGRTTTGEVVAGVAQLVEQRIRNAKVGGSIPLTGTKVISTTEQSPDFSGLFVYVYAPKVAIFDLMCVFFVS